MPSRNILKQYVENGFYHIYNRGVEKRAIFSDKQDYSVFLSYLKDYLTPKDVNKLQEELADPLSSAKVKSEAIRLLRMNNFSSEIDLVAYCLMPNHFHLLIRQNSPRILEKFMRSMCTRYVQYFNKRVKGRVGNLFQDTYKAVLVSSSEQLLHLTRYIHRNPASKGVSLIESPQPSSYPNFLLKISQEWVKPQVVLDYFSSSGFNSYSSFVDDIIHEEVSIATISELMIDYA